MRYLASFIWSAAIGAAGAAPAAAAVIEVSASGTIASGSDGAALFGAPGEDLSGMTYLVKFNIDTSHGFVRGGVDYIDGHGPSYYSSTFRSAGVPAGMSGSIKIGDTMVFIDGSRFGINAYNVTLHTNQNSLRQDVASADTELNFYDLFDPIYPASPLSDPNDGVFHDPNLNPISFSLDTRGYEFLVGSFQATRALGSTSLDLNADKVAYTVISAIGGPTSFVPEPETWTLMLAGFGAVGAAARRRQIKVQLSHLDG